MKKLAIIGAQRMAKNYAINAREMGVETHCFAWEKGAVAKNFVDHFYPVSIFDIEKILGILREVKVDGIVSTSELTIAVVSQLAAELGLDALPLEVAKVVTDKYRNRCATANVPNLHHPKFAAVRDLVELESLGIGFPLIFKPLSEGGKRGVMVVGSAAELQGALAYTKSESKRQDAFLVEEYLQGGKEYSVESLSYHGRNHIIQVTEKITSGPPHCVELGHHQPAALSVRMRQEVERVMDAALTAAGITEGPCHTEIKIIEDKIYLIEFNARPGGDFISYPLIDLSTGYSYLKGAIEIALGDFRPVPGLQKRHSGVCFVTKETSYLEPVFATCQNESWCWRKHDIGAIESLSHNNCDGVNYFIWRDDEGLPNVLRDLFGNG